MNRNQNKHIRERWIYSLFELSHSEYQKRLWILADYEYAVGDYGECVCKYFDDLDLDNGYAEFVTDGIITQTESDIVEDLHIEFTNYVNRTEKQNLSDKNILKDVEWHNITNLALKTWYKLKENTESNSDKELMDELENKYLIKNST